MNELEGLRKELTAAQELLYLVLDHVGEPVRLNVSKAREKMKSNRLIDLSLDEDGETWVIQVKEIPSE
jgi:hypothetical protein